MQIWAIPLPYNAASLTDWLRINIKYCQFRRSSKTTRNAGFLDPVESWKKRDLLPFIFRHLCIFSEIICQKRMHKPQLCKRVSASVENRRKSTNSSSCRRAPSTAVFITSLIPTLNKLMVTIKDMLIRIRTICKAEVYMLAFAPPWKNTLFGLTSLMEIWNSNESYNNKWQTTDQRDVKCS